MISPEQLLLTTSGVVTTSLALAYDEGTVAVIFVAAHILASYLINIERKLDIILQNTVHSTNNTLPKE